MNKRENLEKTILENYKTLKDWELKIKNAHPHEDVATYNFMITKYREIVELYIRIYSSLCKKTGVPLPQEILDLAFDVFPEMILNEDLTTSFNKATIYTKLPGTKIIRIDIAQIFRVADLLTMPESVKAKEFFNALIDVNKMRRTINRGGCFEIGTLGKLQPVTTTANKFDRFWKLGFPNLRINPNRLLSFVPYELSLSEHLDGLHCELGSIFENKSPIFNEERINNFQLSGRLRIYPPGSGVVKLSIILEYHESVNIEYTAKIAKNIENILFVDAAGSKKPCNTLLLDFIDVLITELFVEEEDLLFQERRWLPPTTTFTLYDENNFQPKNFNFELAYLMSLAPGNEEKISLLQSRIDAALISPHWTQNGILTVAGQEVALVFVSETYANGNRSTRKALNGWLSDTHELVMAAAYAQRSFLEEIESISSQRLLDENTNFHYVFSLLSTMKQVLQAIVSIRYHLKKQGTGVLVAFAQSVWIHNAPIKNNYDALDYFLTWLTGMQKEEAAAKLVLEEELANLLQHYLSTLHTQIITHFNREELRTLCFNLGLNYDDLPGEGNINKARELILYFKRRDSLENLQNYLIENRPKANWKKLPLSNSNDQSHLNKPDSKVVVLIKTIEEIKKISPLFPIVASPKQQSLTPFTQEQLESLLFNELSKLDKLLHSRQNFSPENLDRQMYKVQSLQEHLES